MYCALDQSFPRIQTTLILCILGADPSISRNGSQSALDLARTRLAEEEKEWWKERWEEMCMILTGDIDPSNAAQLASVCDNDNLLDKSLRDLERRLLGSL